MMIETTLTFIDCRKLSIKNSFNKIAKFVTNYHDYDFICYKESWSHSDLKYCDSLIRWNENTLSFVSEKPKHFENVFNLLCGIASARHSHYKKRNCDKIQETPLIIYTPITEYSNGNVK
jgi:hypothetical protein